MTGLIVLALLVIAIVAALELSNRRHGQPAPRHAASGIDDRDVARTRLDLLALKNHWYEIGYGRSGQSPVRLSR